MWHNSDALILVAGGNTGDDGPGSIGSPATSKNGVSVGASLNDKKSWEKYGLQSKKYFDKNSLAWFSSRGPTFDNRNKPDICAPGKILLLQPFIFNIYICMVICLQVGI